MEKQILELERNSLTLNKVVVISMDSFSSVILKRVEKASEFAVSAGNSHLSGKLWDQIIDLEASEQIEDHDEVYAEGERIHFLLQ